MCFYRSFRSICRTNFRGKLIKQILKSHQIAIERPLKGSNKSPSLKALWKEHGTSQFEVRITRIPPGGTNTKYHTHTKEEEWFFVLSGSCHICIDGKWEQIGSGDSIFKRIGSYHIFRNFGKEPCEMIMMGANVEGSTAEKLPEPDPPILD